MDKSPAVTISKSSPSVITYPADLLRKRFVGDTFQKQSAGENQTNKTKKRYIVPNSEKVLSGLRKPYFIVEDRVNFTPKPLNDPSFPSASDKVFSGLPALRPLSTLRSGVLGDRLDSAPSSHSLISKFSSTRRSSIAMSVYSMRFSTPSELTWISINLESEDEDVNMSISSEDRAPSMFRLREDPPPRNAPINTEFIVNLTETETIFFLQLPSASDSIGTEQGDIIAETNDRYMKAMQINKTKSHTATQTPVVAHRHGKSLIPRNSRANMSSFASVWDIYDCFEATRRGSMTSYSMIEGQVQHINEERDEDTVSDEFEYEGCKFNSRFLNALMVMERFIKKNQFKANQILYQGLMMEDPLSIDIKCNYSLKPLWSFGSIHTKNRKVTSMCWSSKIQNILAVGYGKFKYSDKCDGLVCIWNTKNPHNPERHFYFENPVTCVNFNPLKAQILAVSFYNGLVLLVDVISRSLKVKASNENYPLYQPVWQVQWFPTIQDSSCLSLVTCGKNGRIFRYKKTKFFVSKMIMWMASPHGNIQGVEQPRKCFARKTQTSSHPSAEVLVPHPADPLLYLVGTAEGCVYTCSINHRHDHIDVFVAHNGPVYAIQFNPFCAKVFLTSGADWCIRIWAETVYTPLITLQSGMAAVQDAVWNPLNSTIIVSVTSHFIDVWDIRRKVMTPKSTTESPSKSLNTVLRFTHNKYNVCVGDADGHVHVMALAEMPFCPAFQEDVLIESIKNVLISQPDLLYKLRRLGPPFAPSEGSSYMTRMYRKLDLLHRAI